MIGGSKVRLANTAYMTAQQNVDTLQVAPQGLPAPMALSAVAAVQEISLVSLLQMPHQAQTAREAIGAKGTHKHARLGVRNARLLV